MSEPATGLPAAQADALRSKAREGEPDRYLAALLAPAAAHESLLAVAALLAELASIPATVSQPMLGEIRLQWWRDAVAHGFAGDASGHPVAAALARARRDARLDVALIERLIDARSHDLAGHLFADSRALDHYLAETEGCAFQLAAGLLDAPIGDEIAREAGIAYGLARALCRLPARLAHGGFPIPADALARDGITEADLHAATISPATRHAVGQAAVELEARARAALAAVRRHLSGLPRTVIIALLPLATVEPYLAAQRQAGLDRLRQGVEPVPLRRIWRIGVARLRGRL